MTQATLSTSTKIKISSSSNSATSLPIAGIKVRTLNFKGSTNKPQRQPLIQKWKPSPVKLILNSDELTEKSQKSINLQFKVKIEFLPTNFCEDIELKEVEMNHQQTMNLQLEKILSEVKILQGLVSKQISSKNEKYYLETQTFNTLSGRMYSLKLKPGKYIFSASGCFINEKLYNGDQYYDNGFGGENIQGSNFQLKLTIEIGGKQQLDFFSTLSHLIDCYEYPYIISGIFEVQEDTQVNFTFGPYQFSDNLIMNSNVLSVSPISHFNNVI